MTTRRSFFKSLALLGSAAIGCPGIFIPKFEPVKWKVTTREMTFQEFLGKETERFHALIAREYYGSWRFVQMEEKIETIVAIKPCPTDLTDVILHVRERRIDN